MDLDEAKKALSEGLKVYNIRWARSWKFMFKDCAGNLKIRITCDDESMNMEVSVDHVVIWYDDCWYISKECKSCYCCEVEGGSISIEMPNNSNEFSAISDSLPEAAARLVRNMLRQSYKSPKISKGHLVVDVKIYDLAPSLKGFNDQCHYKSLSNRS